MLGPLEVRSDDGRLLDIPGARLRGLLIALALKPGQVVPKATLVDWIWGEQPPADAANALQRLVSRLRKALPAGVIEGRADGYRLAVEADGVDAARFERLVGAGQARTRAEDVSGRVRLLREALQLWRGAALQDVGLRDSAAFDAAAVRLDGLRLTATEERAEAEVTLGRGAELITELTDLVAEHPLRERLVAALIRALAAAGRDNEALLLYDRTRAALADALGVDPSPELAALHIALLRGELGRREEGRRTNLRAELSSFVGRDGDVAAVRELVAVHRLTTVIGPGGAGKTRLATETARTVAAELPDGAWLVELAAVGADGDVAQAALAALGLRDALLGGAPNAEPVDRLVAAIRDREALPAPLGPSSEKTVAAATSKSMPSRTTLSPYALRSPETAIAELFMPPRSRPTLTRPCHRTDTPPDTAPREGRPLGRQPVLGLPPSRQGQAPTGTPSHRSSASSSPSPSSRPASAAHATNPSGRTSIPASSGRPAQSAVTTVTRSP